MPNPLTGNTEVGGIAADRLRSIIERVERLEEEKKAINDDIKDIFAEAKSAGFEPKVIKTMIQRRKLERAEVEERDTLLDLYSRAVDGVGIAGFDAPDEEDTEL